MTWLRTPRIAAAALGFALAASAPGDGLAQQKTRLTLALATASFEPGTATYTSLPFMLGLWEEEGLDVRIVAGRGSAQMAQIVISGQAQVAHGGTSAGLMVPLAQGADLVSIYNATTQSFQVPAVPVDSPIRTAADFKGKKIGVQSLGTGTVPVIRAMAQEAGLDPDRDLTFIEVGLGAQAAAALFVTRQVQALGLWDSQYALIENTDPRYRLRTIASPLTRQISFQTAVLTSRTFLKQNPTALAGFCRGMAKATIFALENPEAAVRLHWKKYPEQKPTNVDESLALEQSKRSLLARVSNMRIDNMAIPRSRWGYHAREDVSVYYDLLRRSGEINTPVKVEDLYTNAVIDQINDFDHAAWAKYAREYRVR